MKLTRQLASQPSIVRVPYVTAAKVTIQPPKDWLEFFVGPLASLGPLLQLQGLKEWRIELARLGRQFTNDYGHSLER